MAVSEMPNSNLGVLLTRSDCILTVDNLTLLYFSIWQVYNTRFVEERDGYNIRMEAYRRRKLTDSIS